MLYRLIPLPLLFLLFGCGTFNASSSSPTKPELVTVRFEFDAKENGGSLASPLSTMSVPIEGADGPVTLSLIEDSYRVGRRAAYSEFLLAIENNSDAAIYSPKLEVVEFLFRNRKEPARGEITTSDNGATGVGAVFDYGWTLGDEQELASGALSPSRRWRVEDPEKGFQPYVLVLELSYYTAPMPPELPATPKDEIAEVRGFINPEFNEITITDLRSPYITIEGAPELSVYYDNLALYEAAFVTDQKLEDLFLTDLSLNFVSLRFVSNDQNRYVGLDGFDSQAGVISVPLGELGPGVGTIINLDFSGRVLSNVPLQLKKFEFVATITGTVQQVTTQSRSKVERVIAGVDSRIRLENNAYFTIIDDLPWDADVIKSPFSARLEAVKSDIFQERLRNLDQVSSHGQVIKLWADDHQAMHNLASGTLGLSVTDELAARAARGANLRIYELVTTSSPNEAYWRPFNTPVFPEDMANGWIATTLNLYSLPFTELSGERFGYYVLVAERDANQSLSLQRANSTPSSAPYLLGPDNTMNIRGRVHAPAAYTDVLLNPLTGEPLDTSILCSVQVVVGCSTAEFGDGAMQGYPLGYNHKGLDFKTRDGDDWRQSVMPAASGIVTYAGPRGTWGCTIEIAHPGGFSTLYAHLDYTNGTRKNPTTCDTNVEVGARVKAGETVIGISGNTGTSSGPHLHFELLPTGDVLFKTDPRGIGSNEGSIGNELTTKIYVSYLESGTSQRQLITLPKEYPYLVSSGSGFKKLDYVDVDSPLTRNNVRYLLEKEGASIFDAENTLVYIADAFTWVGRDYENSPNVVDKFIWSKQIFDWAIATGVNGVNETPVPLGKTTVVSGYGMSTSTSGAKNVQAFFHAAGRRGASADAKLEGAITSRTPLTAEVTVPGPSANVGKNAAWGDVRVVFSNGRNSVEEVTRNIVKIQPVIEQVDVTDGVSSSRARGGKTVQLTGSGFLSGVNGEGSLATFLQTESDGQSPLTVSPTQLDPLIFSVVTPDELYSGPALAKARIEEVAGFSPRGGLTVYPYINTHTQSGEAGEEVVISGTNLAPSPVLNFNGASASASSGNPLSASFSVPNGVRSGAIHVVAAGQKSGNGVPFTGISKVTFSFSSSEGGGISAKVASKPVSLDNANAGVYSETGSLSLSTMGTQDVIAFGTGTWEFTFSKSSYEKESKSLDLTTTPREVSVTLEKIPPPEEEETAGTTG